MSRTPQERTTSRTGQIHLCAICVADAGGYGSAGVMKQLTWMLEIPPECDTSARLAGRARTWFCRSCIESTLQDRHHLRRTERPPRAARPAVVEQPRH